VPIRATASQNSCEHRSFGTQQVPPSVFELHGSPAHFFDLSKMVVALLQVPPKLSHEALAAQQVV
tara:strand:+ start:340 stop:534 length:195 start_codon:yes stop_codon:yes gene_type:complete